ncbi:FUSC family protein [Streptomyces griseoaurantiacus]|uniref:FUSC family protein n=1 Tax=Streptomyces griseoaurantiacus TaxID=68213 RepID=UPI003183187C
MRHTVSSASPAPTVALRVALAVAVGTVLGWALPLLHPAWVAVGAAASLQGGPGRQPSQRVGSRFVGTVAGVAITVLVAQIHQPGTGATVAVATVVHGVSRGLPPAPCSCAPCSTPPSRCCSWTPSSRSRTWRHSPRTDCSTSPSACASGWPRPFW